MKITIDIEELKNTPMEDWGEEEDEKLEKAQEEAKPKDKEVVLSDDEAMVEPPETEPLLYKVQKGDTLKKICEKYSVSFGEMTNYMMAKHGSTSIAEGMELEIPRHFIDLSQA